MLVDIVILPPPEIRRKIGRTIKRSVGKSPAFFVVENQRLIPHLSLWHLRISANEIGNLIEELKRAVKGQKPIKVSSAGFRMHPKYKGDVEFTVRENEALIKLQKKILEVSLPFKSGTMPPFAAKWTGRKAEEARQYGRPLGFSPHFTMGWLKKEADALWVVKKMSNVRFSFFARNIYLCEINRWWQVRKVVGEIRF